MPSINLPQAFLNLSNPNDPNTKDFWKWPVFQEMTESYIPPFDLESLQSSRTDLTSSLVEATVTFAKKYWGMSDLQKAKFMNKKGSDQDFLGRQTWKSSISKQVHIWKLERRIMTILKEEGCDPRTIMGDDQSREV